MARKTVKTDGTVLTSWAEVDLALAEIGVLTRTVTQLESEQNKAIDQVKAKTKQKAEPSLSRKIALEEALKAFCDGQRSEFIAQKTKYLTFGSVGYRQSTRVMVKKVGDTLSALKDLGMTGHIRIKEDLDKESLRNLDSETLANIGVALRTENVFGYELSVEEIAEQ